ncbi:hypothetical protein FNF27_06943 [Cafeteria roenbergensis]|uniref:Uncharacterized protein n=1 Tax=Cafeteria roenbergensis TaxID=33653 RepID=A0A5A8DWB3_CAFRO|nr:hypothetical protein FNF27_06943 [Cafeteria roenbergensis]
MAAPTAEERIDKAVADYLAFHGLNDSLATFLQEVRATRPQDRAARRAGGRPSARILPDMMHAFDSGLASEFFRLWTTYVPEEQVTSRSDSDAAASARAGRRLLFYCHVHFAVFPYRRHRGTDVPPEAAASMRTLKAFLDGPGSSLAQTAEFIAYFALPFITDPRGHDSFAPLFRPAWAADLRDQLGTFLEQQLRRVDAKPPTLYRMFKLALQVGLLGTPPGGQPSLPQAGIEEAEQDAEDDEAADQVRTYLNGALYSLLTLPAILDRARACGLEAAVSGAQTASGEVQRRHLGFILRQLRTSSSASQSASGEAAHLVGGRDGLGSGRAAPEDGTQAGSPGRPFAGTIASGAGAERGAGSEGHRTSGHNGDAGHGEGDDVGGVDGNDDDDGHDDDDDEDDDEDDDGELDASEGGAIDADNMDEDEDGDAADVLVAVHAEGEAAGEELLGRLYTQAAVHRRNAAREAAESSGAAEVDRVLPGTDCAALDRPPASEVPDVAPADEVFAARPRILRSPKGRA